jgi:hypothetical protein
VQEFVVLIDASWTVDAFYVIKQKGLLKIIRGAGECHLVKGLALN